MIYKNVNNLYALINSKNEIYDMSMDGVDIYDRCNSFNHMKESFKDELPFRVVEFEFGSHISVE